MSSRRLLALLALVPLLALGVAWVWLQPPPGHRVAGNAAPPLPMNAAGCDALQPTDKPPDSETGLPALKPAPPPPEVPNDPAKGEVWRNARTFMTMVYLIGAPLDAMLQRLTRQLVPAKST